MSFKGDFTAGDTIYFRFTTRRFSTGAPYALAGTPALRVYKDGSDTQSTAGITLTADFDSVTGLNSVAIDTSADGTFYSNGSQFDVVIQAGTVDSVSVVGETVGRFTLGMLLKPTTSGRKLDVSAGGEAGIDWANVGSPATTVSLSATTVGTTSAVTGLTASNLDATVSSRLASASYTAPDNAGIAAIEAKTDSLTFTAPGVVDCNVTYVTAIAITGTGTAVDPWGP